MDGESDTRVQVLVPPQPKTEQCTITDYIDYFEAVATANAWDDTVKARIFPALLGMGNTVLTDCPEADKKSFAKIKTYLTKVGEPYRDAFMLDLFRVRMADLEPVEKYRDRVVTLVEQVYPRFAASNKAALARDFFVCGLPDPMRAAVLNSGSCRKLEEAVNSALMCFSLSGRLGSRGSGGAAGGDHVTWRTVRSPAAPRGGVRSGDPARSGPRAVCWRCGIAGHVRAQCRAPGDGLAGRRMEGIAVSPVSDDGRVYVDIDIDGCPMQLLADSGATVSCLPTSFRPNSMAKDDYVIAANGSRMPVYGLLNCSVSLSGATLMHDFIITDVQRGVVGADLLQKFGASIDFDRGAVLVGVNRHPAGAADSVTSPGSGGACVGGTVVAPVAPSLGYVETAQSGAPPAPPSAPVAPSATPSAPVAPSARHSVKEDTAAGEAPLLDWEEGCFHEVGMLATGN
ncbi:uncharacterized protein LOC122385087 [Amphibalanus amphitrite]|uniref:uncharacterized protein LOC122366886 n=1 Tax=Amphibalanus amphitrite TaxID=1232801 RepID=UPI001C905CDB|nr:uncharacterized protein LOC122366886 [Amphibalanus amphitrite]XP_043216486.1 uncharacterized protein LOC122378907 [Amphibalanus amphitrite]XP_043229029.1 uncharacterized protein LOC122385087 [Amphibalanus amphitrite]